jgi:hypothetical protein
MADEAASAWKENQSAILEAATQFATDAVAPYVLEGDADTCYRFPFNGKDSCLSAEAPLSAAHAASFLKFLHRVNIAKSGGDVDTANQAAFMAGFFASFVWKDNKGRTLVDVFESFETRGRPEALTDEQKAEVVVKYGNLKDANHTNNAAAEILKKQYNVDKSTIERVVGIRQ